MIPSFEPENLNLLLPSVPALKCSSGRTPGISPFFANFFSTFAITSSYYRSTLLSPLLCKCSTGCQTYAAKGFGGKILLWHSPELFFV